VHDLLAQTVGFPIKTHTLHHRLRPNLSNFRQRDLILSFLAHFAGCKLKRKLNFLPQRFLKRIDDRIDMHLGLGMCCCGPLSFIGKRGFSINFILFGGDALILDDVAHADDDFDDLDEGEEDEQDEGDEEFYYEVRVEDDEEGA
jgi:hypothetical protein